MFQLAEIKDYIAALIAGTSAAAIVDGGVSLVAAANVNCTSAAQLSTQTSPAYLIVTNLDASAVVYVGASGVTGSTNGEAIPAGQSRSWRSANPSLEYGIGSSTVNVSVRR
jgi:hypothetical protein